MLSPLKNNQITAHDKQSLKFHQTLIHNRQIGLLTQPNKLCVDWKLLIILLDKLTNVLHDMEKNIDKRVYENHIE